MQVTYTGGIQESWPLGFSGVTALAFSTEEFNDLGALYLRVRVEEARKNNHILLQRGMYLSQKWSTAPFCPPVHRAARPYGLCVLYDIAARVSEICNLCIEDVRFENPPHIRIMGKEMKVRAVPILSATAKNRSQWEIDCGEMANTLKTAGKS